MIMKLIEGLCWRLRYFARFVVCVKRRCSPSYWNHMGLTCTVSSGRIVPRVPNSGRSSRSVRSAGIVALRVSVMIGSTPVFMVLFRGLFLGRVGDRQPVDPREPRHRVGAGILLGHDVEHADAAH